MIGASRRKVRVIGGGFSGLATGFYLSRAGFEVEIFEAQERVGGLIQTVENDFGRVELAANGLLNSRLVEELFSEIDLPLQAPLKESRKRFIFRAGKPRRWPFGFFPTMKIMTFFIRFLFFRTSVAPRKMESIRAWGQRVLGQEVTSFGLEAALQGIYAGDPRKMSASLILGRHFKKAKKKNDGRLKYRGTVTAPYGMGQLISTLRSYLERRGVKFTLGKGINEFTTSLDLPLVIATNARDASALLEDIDPERSAHLKSVEMAPILTATLFFDKPLPKAMQGFGILFPPAERKPVLGVLMNNFIFPNRAKQGFSETWIMGGAASTEDHLEKSDQEILNTIIAERETCFGTQSALLHSRITRWPAALPHYTVTLEEQIQQIRENRLNIFLIGNYLGEIGLAKILERAKTISEEIGAQKE